VSRRITSIISGCSGVAVGVGVAVSVGVVVNVAVWVGDGIKEGAVVGERGTGVAEEIVAGASALGSEATMTASLTTAWDAF